MKSRLALPVGALYLLLVAFVVTTFALIKVKQENWRTDSELVTRTHRVLATVNELLAKLNRMESLDRGYILTHDQGFLRDFDVLEQSVSQDLFALDALVVLPSLRSKRTSLEPLVVERMNQMRATMRLFETRGLAAAVDFIRSGQGQRTRQRIDAIVDAIFSELQELRLQREAQTLRSSEQLEIMFLLSFLANLLLVSVAMASLARYLSRRRKEQREHEARAWASQAQASLAETLATGQSLERLTQRVLEILANHAGALVGTFYFLESESRNLKLVATHAANAAQLPPTLPLGEGLTGGAARLGKTLRVTDLPGDYCLRIASSLGEQRPHELFVIPIQFQDSLHGVVELGFLEPPSPLQIEFLETGRERIGATLEAFKGRARLELLLAQTQEQSQKLAAQQEELRTSNEELLEQTELLQRSETLLEEQQKELEERNFELKAQARNLEEQSRLLRSANQDLQKSEETLRVKAEELAQASRYKTEFLANMSHEIRTPLNSILILSQLLVENAPGNLTSQQMESARTIVSSGRDLLTLLNDVLDLAKIESGRLQVEATGFSLQEVLKKVELEFRTAAERKGLDFAVASEPDTPQFLVTDRSKLEQILRNLLGNAIKFTEKGGVRLTAVAARGELDAEAIAFHVADTGIGIPSEKHGLIFEAFQQADGSTSRRYGGTGLGLSIAREMARLLGGDIGLESTAGTGSLFTLRIPTRFERSARPASEPSVKPHVTGENPAPFPRIALEDDRHGIEAHDFLLHVIEDEPDFAKALGALAREKGFKLLVSLTGEEGLRDAEQFQPLGIVLDIKLPGMSGMEVLGRLKSNPRTRHIPVHVVSGVDVEEPVLRQGAIGFLMKPALPDRLRAVLDKVGEFSRRQVKRLLLVEDDVSQQKAMVGFLGGEGVEVVVATSAQDALRELGKGASVDCMVLDLRLPDMDGLDLLEQMARGDAIAPPPVVVYTGKTLSREEERRLGHYARSIVIKGARSPERLLSETTLFLHQMESSLSDDKRFRLQNWRTRDTWLSGKTILLADDDMRNVYALLKVLESKGASVAIASNGKEAVDYLATGNRADLVLMDVMMPVMDGFDAAKTIRSLGGLDTLPIIALTAKAMRSDRERCFEAGMSDYITKPIDIERLDAVLKVWLSNRSF